LHRVDAGVVDVFAVQEDLSCNPGRATVSFIRFRQRRKVDLPQPDGPMKAVTARSRILTLTSFSAWFVP
jgi:hypothetical protein